MEWTKVKSVEKRVILPGDFLDQKVLNTMETISNAVGATLGPGGRPVLIERQEYHLPGMVTKDGVTVFKSLGFKDPVEHSIMESARDAAIRTVAEAGDGTTTATILAYALVKYSQKFLKKNPHYSPQKLVRIIQNVFEKEIEPFISKKSVKIDFSSKKGQKILKDVAKLSANGDEKLAEAVMEAFNLVGDNGTITIIESSGPTSYKIEKIEGYPIPIGYEESCTKFMSAFINDVSGNRVYLKNPGFVIYNGIITDIQVMLGVLEKLQFAWLNRPGTSTHNPEAPFINSPNIVFLANGFSESVLGSLALNMPDATSINLLPLLTPKSAILNGEVHFLEDVSAITGATVFNYLSKPLDSFELNDLGRVEVTNKDGTKSPGEFEMFRFRSTIIGINDEDEIVDRSETLEGMVKSAISEYDARVLKERLSSLVGGIAKLTVVGSSNGELRERKDRADDAVRAVQGTIRKGAFPGGGWGLLGAIALIKDKNDDPVINEVLVPSLLEPVIKLFANCGVLQEELVSYLEYMNKKIVEDGLEIKKATVYDLSSTPYLPVNALDNGILDSAPALLEAIRNSISIASLLGTLGGIVVFERDKSLEREEAMANEDFVRNANINPANERA